MNRFTAAARHEGFGFRLYSFLQELRVALLCPVMTHKRDLKLPAL